ncbi:MAG TPA: hypothetical protein VIG33_07075 [Pseudobdellovibrionaceae bacterium]|jgi:hypothetical protein
MKSIVLILSLLATVALAVPSKETKNRSSESAVSTQKNSEATNYNFEDLLVQGKYNFSDEAVTTVEEDKVLDSLIGVRSDFKDRLKSSTGSY